MLFDRRNSRTTYDAERWEAQLIPEEGTEVGKMVKVEARIDIKLGKDDAVPDITTWR